jgi:hypothetical protein
MGYFRKFLACIALCAPAALVAQSNALEVELNAAQTVGEACQLTFVIRNGLQTDVEKFVVETVLFTEDGQVSLLTLFDFARVPAGRPRVRQFQVPNASCDGISMVLINGADTCTGEGLDVRSCEAAMVVSSRTSIALEG